MHLAETGISQQKLRSSAEQAYRRGPVGAHDSDEGYVRIWLQK